MVCFQTKNVNLGKFCETLNGKILIYFLDIWNILRTIGKFYDHFTFCVDLVHFYGFCYHVPIKSGNPAVHMYIHMYNGGQARLRIFVLHSNVKNISFSSRFFSGFLSRLKNNFGNFGENLF
jgi:hypothetical protein